MTTMINCSVVENNQVTTLVDMEGGLTIKTDLINYTTLLKSGDKLIDFTQHTSVDDAKSCHAFMSTILHTI